MTATSGDTDLEALESISKAANISVPESIRALFSRPARHDLVVDKNEIEPENLKFLQG